MAPSVDGPFIGPSPINCRPNAVNSAVACLPDLPAGFPSAVDSQMAWVGNQFEDRSDYILALSDLDLEEIRQALAHFKALGLDGDLVSKENFPLASLGPKLLGLRQDLHHGKGFGVIRGLDPREFPVEDLTVIYLGLQTYIANRQGRQDKKGNMLVHIIADDSSAVKAQHHRHSTAPITFHNEESGDIVSWLTRSTASSGGKCIIASGHTVYNVLAATRPDLVRTLVRSDWPFALPQFQCRPVYFHRDGRLMLNFGRASLLGSPSHPRPQHLPGLSSRQAEALDAVEQIAKASQLEIATRPGDIHFINNLTILHRREGFVNGAASTERRHLVRMRLRDDDLGWSIPSELQSEWDRAFCEDGRRAWHLEPMPDGYFPLRSQPN